MASVLADPEPFLRQYQLDQRSFDGRYIVSDLFKETFAVYASSKESRSRFVEVVHNSSAVLASAQFHVVAQSATAGHQALFITGVPGAGKTTTVLSGGGPPPGVTLIYEGQLSDPATGMEKLQVALDAGLRPTILAVHPTPELALERTLRRFVELGRGASLAVMASIHGGLADGLSAIEQRFGNKVSLVVRDYRNAAQSVDLHGWQHISTLRSEGTRAEIRKRLQNHLDKLFVSGRVSSAAYEQAAGVLPVAIVG